MNAIHTVDYGLAPKTVDVLMRLQSTNHIPSSQKRYLEIVYCIEPVKHLFLEKVKTSLLKMANYTDVDVGTLMDYTGNVWVSATYKLKFRVSTMYNMDKHTTGSIRCVNLLGGGAREIQEYRTRYMAPLEIGIAGATIANTCVSISHIGGVYAKCIGHCSLFENKDAVFKQFLERLGQNDSSDDDSSDDDSSDEEWDELSETRIDSDDNPDYDKWDFDLVAEFSDCGMTQIGSMEEVD